jgi:hypothetical protein
LGNANTFLTRKVFAMKGLTSSVIVMVILVSSLVVVNTINPLFRETSKLQAFNEARQTIHVIDSTINQILLETTGSKRSLDLSVRDGRLIASSADDTIIFHLEGVNDILLESGFVTEEGRVIIRSGGKMRAYEEDIDGDGDTDLVLENGASRFAIQKLGSESSYVDINTSTAITQLRNMRLGVTATLEKSGIFINDIDASSYGNGFTKLSRIGENLESSSILMFVNSTSGITYEAVFEMAAGEDFVQLKLKRLGGV